jgi:hypothetical protein
MTGRTGYTVSTETNSVPMLLCWSRRSALPRALYLPIMPSRRTGDEGRRAKRLM